MKIINRTTIQPKEDFHAIEHELEVNITRHRHQVIVRIHKKGVLIEDVYLPLRVFAKVLQRGIKGITSADLDQ